jgi:hypothetical protein
MVERAFVVPPASQVGPLTDSERSLAFQNSALYEKYKTAVDRESAYERLKGRSEEKLSQVDPLKKPESSPVSDVLFGKTGPRGGRQTQGLVEAVAKSAARTIGSEIGRQVIRGILGSILGSAKKRR